MAEQPNKNARQDSDEIDLGQLFRYIANGFQNLFNSFLRVFIYLKRNILILLALGVVGLAIGYGLSKIITKKQKVQVIVKPNWESKNYLFDVIDEVEANLTAKDTAFFNNLGVTITDFSGYEVEIEPITNASDVEEKEQMEYLQILQNFESSPLIMDVLRAELLNKTALNYRITFLFKDKAKGTELAKAVIENLNSNNFYSELAKINKENSENRIAENKALIEQIDKILTDFSAKMAQSQSSPSEGRIVLSTEEEINVSELLELKGNLIRDTERMKMDLVQLSDPVSIINFGKPQEVQRSFLGKKVVWVPLLLILLFLLFDFIRFLNRKAQTFQK